MLKSHLSPGLGLSAGVVLHFLVSKINFQNVSSDRMEYTT